MAKLYYGGQEYSLANEVNLDDLWEEIITAVENGGQLVRVISARREYRFLVTASTPILISRGIGALGDD